MFIVSTQRWAHDNEYPGQFSVISRLPRSTIRRLDERTFLSEIPELGVQQIYPLYPGGVEVAR